MRGSILQPLGKSGRLDASSREWSADWPPTPNGLVTVAIVGEGPA
jgi:hypothetical protein